jgi:uncharacterized protein
MTRRISSLVREKNEMTKLLLILMVVGLWSGCGKDIKVWKEEYSKDKVKEEYQYYHHPNNNRRIKDGWYNSYYSNGEYWEVGTYKDNERHEEWTYFTINGKETKGIYKDGKMWSGEFWIETENDITEEYEGNKKTLHKGLFTYEDGLWNGLGILYWENGNKRGEGLYEDGKHEGFYKKYFFYYVGEVEWEGNYVNGKLDGNKVKYYVSGKVWGEENYVDGKEEGKWVFYDEDGTITDEDIWKDGECVEMCEGDE